MWRDLFGSDRSGIERIEAQLLEMLDANRHTLDLAVRGLLGDDDPDALRQQISDSDHRVNALVQQVRRELIVHATTRGKLADLPVAFATMSIVKDIERVGDYAKQLGRIARVGGPLSDDHPLRGPLVGYRDRLDRHITEVRDALASRDPDEATPVIDALQQLLDELDTRIDGLLTTDPMGGVACALAYQYLSRSAAHLVNVLTSVVMPLDKLDFYDEERAGEES